MKTPTYQTEFHPMKNNLRLWLVASCVVLLSTSLAQAQTLIDENFNSYTNGANFPTGPSGWTQLGTPSAGVITGVTSTAQESPFTATPGGLGYLQSDSSTTLGSGFGIKKTFTAQTGTVEASFDFVVLDAPVDNNAAVFNLYSGNTYAFNLGLGAGGTNLTITNGGTLQAITLGTWYHVALTANVATDFVTSISVTPNGGSTVNYGPVAFSTAVANVDNLRIFANTVNLAQGQFAIDNVSVVAVPEPGTNLLLGFALCVLGLVSRGKYRRFRSASHLD